MRCLSYSALIAAHIPEVTGGQRQAGGAIVNAPDTVCREECTADTIAGEATAL
jgi:hypothetical protein